MRRRIEAPTRPKPAMNIAHVVGSGIKDGVGGMITVAASVVRIANTRSTTISFAGKPFELNVRLVR